MPLSRGEPLTLRFGGTTPASVDAQLELAAQHYYTDATLAEQLLLQARQMDPQCLAVYFSLYKFYFYKQQLTKAEQTVNESLRVAAELGSFSAFIGDLQPDSAPWHAVSHPAHFFLFSLKALAFICLRQNRINESAALLDKLAELDPHDQVGGSVIRALLLRCA